MPWTDNRNRALEVGQSVVYNLSGQVAKGEILRVTTGCRYGRSCPIIKIELAHAAGGFPRGHVSTVLDSRSVLVVKDDA